MSAFHDVRFPLDISRRAHAVIARRTEIVVLGSGHEQRNARWRDARRRFEIGYGIKTIDDLHEVIAFFEARRGRLHGFRFRDWSDWKSCPPLRQPTAADQVIGTGDGAAVSFQLVKSYGSGSASFTRPVTLPVIGSLRVAIDGVEQASGWSADGLTGQLTFDDPPPAGALITAGFEFDVPVRFDSDELRIDLEHFRAGGMPDIELVEIRP